MRKRAILFALLVTVAATGIWIAGRERKAPPSAARPDWKEPAVEDVVRPPPPSLTPVPPERSTPRPSQTPAPAAKPKGVPAHERGNATPAGPAAIDPVQRREVEIELDSVSTHIRDFRLMFGGNPVGTNAEITKALSGKSEKHVTFLEGGKTNAEGELIDRWNTPYFFHQISSTEMEIRSAGPDKIMWTADDVVAK